jgi:tripartite-type tricarboxylate transporter receptor subunit TctC
MKGDDGMRLSRRGFLAATCAAMFPHAGSAQATYPTQTARIVVGFSAGSATDIIARLIGQWLTDKLGRQFVIENRPGVGGNIATDTVVRAPADGYTLLLAAPSHAINATLYPKLGYDFVRDIAPVAGLVDQPNLLVAHPSIPAQTVPELVAYAKANPGRISFGSSGKGSSNHLAGEMLKTMTGIEMVHVPYRGGAAAVADLLAGRIQLWFGAPSTAMEYIGSGQLRLLAVTTPTRWFGLPNVPAMGESIPGYAMSTWFGLGAPRGTPPEVVDRLNRHVNRALTDPGMKARFSELGCIPIPGSPDDFARLIADEIEKWGKVIRASALVE